MRSNYHTHTRWCRHGEGEIEDYIQEAIRKELDILAITEHVPYRDDFDPRRMQWGEFPVFNEELDRMIEKYKGRIRILKGFECEYNPAVMEDYRMFREEYGYDIMILGQHLSKDRKTDNFAAKGEREFAVYVDEVIEGLSTGFFTFLAHPDVAMCRYHGSMEFALGQMGRIFSCCERMGIPVEINANGLRGRRGYPDREVLAFSRKYRLKYLINSDAHYVEDLYDEEGIGMAKQWARELGIEVSGTL